MRVGAAGHGAGGRSGGNPHRRRTHDIPEAATTRRTPEALLLRIAACP